MNNSTEKIINDLKRIIVEDLNVNITLENIKNNESLYDEGLGLDSISIVNLIVLVEKKFDIIFDESEISYKVFGSISSLAEFIGSKINQ